MKKTRANPRLPARYCRMSPEELDAETEKFDQEFIADRAKPLGRKFMAKLRRARQKRGRPRVGKGAKRILISVEKDLLKRSDAFARKWRMSRSQLIARGLETVLAGERARGLKRSAG